MPARFERGQAPFTEFAVGALVVVGGYNRVARPELLGHGFVTVSVVDAQGMGDGCGWR